MSHSQTTESMHPTEVGNFPGIPYWEKENVPATGVLWKRFPTVLTLFQTTLQDETEAQSRTTSHMYIYGLSHVNLTSGPKKVDLGVH